MTITIELLRHGKVAGESGLYGKTDIKVSEEGWAAVKHQLSGLKIDGEVFSSPLRRCKDSAQDFSDNTKIIEPLAEMDFGDWDGVPFSQLEAQWPQLHEFWQSPGSLTPPNGESLDTFYQRVVEGWQQVVEQCQPGHNLVVCHGGVIRVILAHILNIDINNGRWFACLNIDYASLTQVVIPEHQNAIPVIAYINKAHG